MRHQASVPLALLVAGGVAFAASHTVASIDAQSRGPNAPPAFDVDRMWPKPLPNHWILGSITGLSVDSQDHIWIVHRGLESLTARTEAGTGTTPPTAEDCCAPAPPVLEFDAAGTLVGKWGGPGQGFDWPVSPGGIEVDTKGNVWITAAGVPDVPAAVPNPAGAAAGGRAGGGGRANAAPPKPADAHVLKFSRTGQFVLQIGKAGEPGPKDSTTGLDKPADVAVDAAAGEVYVADGGTHQRIAVFDATSGAFKRQWTGHTSEFGRVSCVALSKDGLVYVCDRKNDRIQVFKKDGTFVREALVAKTTMLAGSVWDITFSNDAAQRYAFVADGQNDRVWVLDRYTLDVVGDFGDVGGLPGSFRLVGSVGMDSKGNLYTGETFEGKRVQKFLKK
jgi:DNA-binding beta-propeller fold protein YncE